MNPFFEWKHPLTLNRLGLSSSASLLLSTVIALSRPFPCSSIFFSLSFSCVSCFCLSLFSCSRSFHSSSSRKRWRFWNSALISCSRSSNLFYKIRGKLNVYYVHLGVRWILNSYSKSLLQQNGIDAQVEPILLCKSECIFWLIMQQQYLYFHWLYVRLSLCFSAHIYFMLDSFNSLDKLFL